MNIKKTLKAKVLPIAVKLQPAAKVAERIARLAIQVRKPSVMSAIGLASAGINVVIEQLGDATGPGLAFEMYMSRGQVIQAMQEAGATMRVNKNPDGTEHAQGQLHSTKFTVYPNACVIAEAGGGDLAAFQEWLRQAVDKVLPPTAVQIRKVDVQNRQEYEARDVPLTRYNNEQALRILQDTLPLLEGGRCILLDGKPGVGKTTMAQIIAREAGLGRAVLLDSSILGHGDNPLAALCGRGGGSFRDALAMLSPGVVVLDDIDKLVVSLSTLEALRSAAKLVILTANNGQYDEVLDGSMIRAGRVDEVFTIDPAPLPREAPFDQLSDVEWSEVSQWPYAYLTEVKKRLQHRPDCLRLDDLRARLMRKTRSVNGLY